jgi:hypothetical protein
MQFALFTLTDPLMSITSRPDGDSKAQRVMAAESPIVMHRCVSSSRGVRGSPQRDTYAGAAQTIRRNSHIFRATSAGFTAEAGLIAISTPCCTRSTTSSRTVRSISTSG